VSGHGYGHATRSEAILAALREAAPDAELHVVSDAPERLFASVAGVRYRARPIEVGLVQRDGVESDIAATEVRLERFLDEFEALAEDEARFLGAIGARIVVGDIPAIAFAAAARAGVPSIAVSNFTWDFIYAPRADASSVFRRAVERFSDAYRNAELHLRLPFSPPSGPFRRSADVPLVVRPARTEPAATRAALGLAADPRPLVLLSFGGLGMELAGDGFRTDPLHHYLRVGGVETVKTEGNFTSLPGSAFFHPDLISAASVVVSKPGYGIVSEAVAAGRPLLYVARHDFPEFPILVDGLRRHVPCLEVSLEDVRSGAIGGAVAAMEREIGAVAPSPARRRPIERVDGARVVANEVLALARSAA
jgi:L-arabinokinase